MTLSLLFISVLVGTALAEFLPTNKKNHDLLLVFSGAFLLAVTLLEMLPEVLYENKTAAQWVLLGVLIQLILEYITKGIEHGHVHDQKSKWSLYLIFIGLFIHSFFDGIPLAHNEHLIWGIIVHKIPIALVFWTFVKKHQSGIIQWLFLFLFLLSSPLGYWFGYLIKPAVAHTLMALVCGMFLHISSTIIFESSHAHHFNFKKLISILVAMLLAYLSLH